ncbi:carboxyl-terminal processing protease [Candidatus Gastranaerophilus sp. (ex Termes propinquus)]|nr:carboxyl-terminal processing protease [Candidatus Gastranaerophilus sp. (ex Termes propinquus)]
MVKAHRIKLLLIYTLCPLILFISVQKTYDFIQQWRIASILTNISINNSNKEKIAPQELFLHSWFLVGAGYWDADLNGQKWGRWKKRYLDVIETDEDATLAINTMLASLNDPYSKFLSAEDFSEQNSVLDSKFFGIGVNIASISGKAYIMGVIKGAPAELAGIKPGDILLKVNNVDIGGKTMFEIAKYIKGGGAPGSVELEVLRGGQKLVRKMKREEIKIKSVESSMLSKEVGYIRILSFISQETPYEFVGAMNAIKHSEVLILDLRGNSGGLFQNALFVADMFLPNGPIVDVIGRDGSHSKFVATNKAHGGWFWEKPLVVLVDGESASASEIVSGALKDHKRAKLVGEQTFGKGLVQKIFMMPNETGMNLTIARYLTPLGEDINHKGIAPDYMVEQPEQHAIKGKDSQLEFALSIAQAELEK